MENQRIKEIAESYHDRAVYSSLSGSRLKCECCENEVTTLVSIEHDSKDYSKDLSVCHVCYEKIVFYWKENKLNKHCIY